MHNYRKNLSSVKTISGRRPRPVELTLLRIVICQECRPLYTHSDKTPEQRWVMTWPRSTKHCQTAAGRARQRDDCAARWRRVRRGTRQVKLITAVVINHWPLSFCRQLINCFSRVRQQAAAGCLMITCHPVRKRSKQLFKLTTQPQHPSRRPTRQLP